MASTKMKYDESSMASAPQPITPACFRIAGIAMLPTAEAPVKNFVAFTQLLDVFIRKKILSILMLKLELKKGIKSCIITNLGQKNFTHCQIPIKENNHQSQQRTAKALGEGHTLLLQQQ